MKLQVAYPAFKDSFEYSTGQSIKVWNPDNPLDLPDIMIFTGGEDVNPEYYGEKNLYSGFTLKRDLIESSAFSFCVNKNIPMFGSCRGIQMLNVLLGGSLWQDLGRQCNKSHFGVHPIDYRILLPFLSDLEIVNSLHHQGLKKLGNGIEVVAEYMGTPEIIWCKEPKLIACQFHPELSSLWGDKFINESFNWLLSKETL